MASQGVLNLANCGINRMPEKRFSWIEYIPVTFASVLFILQIVIGIYLLSEVSQIEVFAYFGVGLYVFSGLIFGMLPVLEFRKKGGVSKGQSYIHTTRLVDTGIYSVVRHPQYVTFIARARHTSPCWDRCFLQMDYPSQTEIHCLKPLIENLLERSDLT
jgi:protein-S-isoprenylcysteine O-methyltransferase Ste14